MQKIKCVYGLKDTVLMADVECNGMVKRVQHVVFDELVRTNEADLSLTEYKNFGSFVVPADALNDYVGRMLRAERYCDGVSVVDLRGVPYHGGTTLSSGVLPKWDIGGVFIKCCSLSPAGNWLADSLHESYIMDLFADTGAEIAPAVPAYVVFTDAETKKETARLCEVAVKFTGEMTYYRDLRRTRDYGAANDEILDFAHEFPSAVEGLLNMLLVDYITNQEDRHAKNFGVLRSGGFAPLYDNGAAFHYAEPDERLHLAVDDATQVKFLRKPPLRALREYTEWLGVNPSVDLAIVAGNLDKLSTRYAGLMSKGRIKHNRAVVERRLAECAEFIG